MSGIFLVYSRYIPYIFFLNCHIPGICPVYFLSVYKKYIPSIYLYCINIGIYQVYTLNIQFFPSAMFPGLVH